MSEMGYKRLAVVCMVIALIKFLMGGSSQFIAFMSILSVIFCCTGDIIGNIKKR